jgi:8-oxo-dGTP diphosphatase
MITCLFENGRKTSLRHVTVDALFVDHQKVLLVKRSENLLLEGGKYALPGGFLNRDETLAQGVLRELKEETGYQGRIISLFRVNSRPERRGEDRQNVTFVFLIEPVKQESQPDAEVQSIHWFALNNLPDPSEIAFDHWENIKLYRAYQNSPRPLPILD